VWAGLLISGMVHAAGVAVLMDVGHDGRDDSSARTPDDSVLPELEEERNRLGIAQSRQVTVNWLGYEDPTPSKGLPSEIEQAALSVVPVGVPVENPSAVAAETPEPGDAPTESSDPVEPVRATAEAKPAADPAPEPVPAATSPSAEAESAPLLTLPDTDLGLPEPVETPSNAAASERVESDGDKADTPEPTEEAEAPSEPGETPAPTEPALPSTPAADAGGGPSGGDDLPGDPSDRESAPTSKDPVVNIDDWGRPAAGEGIEVIPRRPRWGPTIAAVAMPRSPTVLVEFDRTGRVRKASFVKENGKVLSTGSTEVDRVLLNSVYNWRAKGEKIEALPAEGPGSLFKLRMHIRLRM
jgi:hypothetical protein